MILKIAVEISCQNSEIRRNKVFKNIIAILSIHMLGEDKNRWPYILSSCFL